jgi:hypothetical protein
MADIKEFLPAELDLFTENSIQLAITSIQEHSINPLNAIDENSLVIEFNCPGYDNKLKDLQELYLQCTVQLLNKSDKKPFADNLPFGHLVNGGLTSMIKSASLYFNDIPVIVYNDNYGIQEFIQNTLGYEKAAACARLMDQGYFISDHSEKQKNLLKGSKNVQLFAKLNLFNVDKFLLPNVNLKVKLVLNSQDWFLVEETKLVGSDNKTSDSYLKIHDITLFVTHIEVSQDYCFSLENKLSKGALAIYESKIPLVLNCSIPSTQSSFSINSLYTGLAPSFALVCFLNNDTYNGNRTSDALRFSTHSVKEFQFIVNHQPLPSQPFTIENTNSSKKYARVYNSLMNAIGLSNTNKFTVVSPENYLDHYFFIAQDLSRGRTATTGGLNEVLENSHE